MVFFLLGYAFLLTDREAAAALCSASERPCLTEFLTAFVHPSLKVWPPGERHREHEAVTDLANSEDVARALGREQIQR